MHANASRRSPARWPSSPLATLAETETLIGVLSACAACFAVLHSFHCSAGQGRHLVGTLARAEVCTLACDIVFHCMLHCTVTENWSDVMRCCVLASGSSAAGARRDVTRTVGFPGGRHECDRTGCIHRCPSSCEFLNVLAIADYLENSPPHATLAICLERDRILRPIRPIH